MTDHINLLRLVDYAAQFVIDGAPPKVLEYALADLLRAREGYRSQHISDRIDIAIGMIESLVLPC